MKTLPFPGVALVALIETVALAFVGWSNTNLVGQPWLVLIPPLATLIIKLAGLLLNPDPPPTSAQPRRKSVLKRIVVG